MKKHVFFVLVFAMVFARSNFAQGISLAAGGGLLLDWSTNNGVKYGSNYMGNNNLSFGGFGFFDATYGEADISFAYGSLSAYKSGNVTIHLQDVSAFQLSFSFLGKYPIGIGSVTLFPLLGISYNMVLSAKNDSGSNGDPSDLNQFGFLIGGGLDFPLTSAIFLRGETLLHIRLPCEEWSDYAVGGADTTIGFGPRIKVGVGYKF